MNVVALDRIAPQPWKNGGGFTRELLAWPRPEAWWCRISVADITRDGPFSAFPRIERWITVVEGHGIVLQFADRREVLDLQSPPLHFDGALAPDCFLQSGATRDLNLMLRTEAGTGGLLRAQPGAEWFSTAPLRALFTTRPALLQVDDADAARLPPMSLAVSTHAARQRWRVALDDGAAWWLRFEANKP